MTTRADVKRLTRILESPDVRASLKSFLAAAVKLRRPSAYGVEAKKARGLEEKKERLSKKEARAAVRAACVERAGGFCECCGCSMDISYLPHTTAEWDEFYGRTHVSVEETWMLRREHHRLKTENNPSREYWDAQFKAHCEKYGYPFRKRFCKTKEKSNG